MKKRTGFVSNSSSTSFVIIGFEIETPTEEEKEALACRFEGITKEEFEKKEDKEYFVYTVLENYLTDKKEEYPQLVSIEDGKSIIGITFSFCRDDPDKKIDIKRTISKVLELSEKFGIERQSEINIYTGLRC